MNNDASDLALRALTGEAGAEKQLYEYFRVRFIIIAKLRVGGADAEDIAHEACLTIREKLKKDNLPPNMEAWALNILHNKIGNYYQRQTTHNRVISKSYPEAQNSNEGGSADSSELYLNLKRCMKKLITQNNMFARVLNLAYQGYKTEEICERLAIKSGHFYVILGRSRKQLRSCLEGRGDE